MFDISLELTTLINFLGFFQGAVLGVLLLFLNRKRNKSILYVSIFVICYALGILIDAFRGLFDFDNPRLTLFFNTINFTSLLFPLFYYYVKQVSIFNDVKNHKLLYLPVFMILLQLFMVFFLPATTQSNSQIILEIINFITLFYGVAIGICTARLILKHKKALLNQYASIQQKELKWALMYVLSGIVFELISALSFQIGETSLMDMILTIINVGLLYWISLRAVLQQKVIGVLHENQQNGSKYIVEEVNALNVEKELQDLVNELDEKIIETEIFKQHNLSIIEIADLANVHPRKVSLAINTITNQNFNSYINTFRINKAKAILLSEMSNKLSIEGVGNEVGFQSKSAFYASFKKLVGETPTKFKQSSQL